MNRFSIKTKVNALTSLCLVLTLTTTLALLSRAQVNIERDQEVFTSHMRLIELATVQQLSLIHI